MNKEIHNPNLKEVNKINDQSTSFVIEPVDTGYGMTLGNSLRRVLLSSIKGAAITAFRIDGATHEYTVIPGVKEDVLDITLNLKALRIKSFSDKPVSVSIAKKGGVIKAADIKVTDQIEIVDPEQVIATIDDPKKTLKIDLIIETGRGYQTIEESGERRLHSDMIAVDALFSPVTRVRYSVEAARFGHIDNLDKLTLTIDTDGTIKPEDAFEEAAAILADQYKSLAGKTVISNAAAYGENEEFNEEKLDQSIENIGFSKRTVNALLNNDVVMVRDLVGLSEEDLTRFEGLGVKGLTEIREKLAELEF